MQISGFTDSNKPIDLHFLYCGHEKCTPGHSWGPGVKDHFKIHYVHEGKGTFQAGSKTYKLEQGNGFLICPDVISRYKADKEYPWTYSWIVFNGLNTTGYLERAGLNAENPIIFDNSREIHECIRLMLGTDHTNNSSDLELLGLLYHFLTVPIDHSASSAPLRPTAKPSSIYVSKALEYIKSNYSARLSITDIAEYIGLDRKYLSTVFKKHLNTSPMDFLINFRMNKACELLLGSQLSISDVSRSVGYEDPLSFSRMFKKIKGVSPINYKSTSHR